MFRSCTLTRSGQIFRLSISLFYHIPRQEAHRPLRKCGPSGGERGPHLTPTGFGQPRQPGRNDRGHDRTEKARPADGGHLACGAKGSVG
jgi:hypothetical protein